MSHSLATRVCCFPVSCACRGCSVCVRRGTIGAVCYPSWVTPSIQFVSLRRWGVAGGIRAVPGRNAPPLPWLKTGETFYRATPSQVPIPALNKSLICRSVCRHKLGQPGTQPSLWLKFLPSAWEVGVGRGSPPCISFSGTVVGRSQISQFQFLFTFSSVWPGAKSSLAGLSSSSVKQE